MKGITKIFMDELKTGFLQPVLKLVQDDRTLILEIRDNCINIYYRGGNILEITEIGDGYKTFFDRKYLDEDSTRVPKLPSKLKCPDDVKEWMSAIPFLKHEMDLWFGQNPKNEREFQQLMVRENNYKKLGRYTDYFICDIEYAISHGEIDLIAVHWPAKPTVRKNNDNLGFAFMEMKYMDGALEGTAGLEKHLEDINEFLKKPKNLKDTKKEMKKVFNEKLSLGLIDCGKPIGSFNNNKPECILILANHDPDKRKLKKILEQIQKDQHKTPPTYHNIEIKVAVSNFMGYGLFDQSIYTLDKFMEKFKDQIYDENNNS